MHRKLLSIFSLVLVLVVAFSAVAPVAAQPSANAKGGLIEASSNGVYIVQMVDNPVVAYQGEIRGLKATAPRNGQKIDPNSADVINYVSYLTNKHDNVLSRVDGGQKLYDYSYSYNGFAAKLSLDQANKLASLDGVVSVSADEFHYVNTSSTPSFLGLNAPGGLWEQLGGTANAGD